MGGPNNAGTARTSPGTSAPTNRQPATPSSASSQQAGAAPEPAHQEAMFERLTRQFSTDIGEHIREQSDRNEAAIADLSASLKDAAGAAPPAQSGKPAKEKPRGDAWRGPAQTVPAPPCRLDGQPLYPDRVSLSRIFPTSPIKHPTAVPTHRYARPTSKATTFL